MRSFLFESFQTKEENLHVIYVPNASLEQNHVHNFIEIVYVTSGCIEHTIDHEIYECYKGDLIIIDIDAIHSFKVKNKASYFNICIKNDGSKDAAFYKTLTTENIKNIKNKIIAFSGDDRREIENIMQNMYHEERCSSIEKETVYNSYANILMVKIIRKLNEKHNEYDNFVSIINYIDKNLDGQLSLNSVARLCSYNPSYFSRLFKAKNGVSFNKYVNKKKIEKAKEYLLNTEVDIEEIAAKLGFSSIQAFYKTFKAFEKMPPIKYKEKHSHKK